MSILDILIIALLVSWLGGYSMQFAGGLIHVLLGVALVMLIVRLARGGRL